MRVLSRILSLEFLDAHADNELTRSLEMIMRTRERHIQHHTQLQAGMKVLICYNSYKQNEDNKWINVVVQLDVENIVM